MPRLDRFSRFPILPNVVIQMTIGVGTLITPALATPFTAVMVSLLPAFAAERDYDAVVMGALTRRPGMVALVGTLTSKLVDTVACDFVLVKSQN